MQLLVTGGLGFIGSNFVRYILTKHPDYQVVNLDAVTYAGHRQNLADMENLRQYHFVEGRIEDRALVEQVVSGQMFGNIDAIVNIAAETHVDRSIHDPAVFVNTNILGTHTLLEATYQFGHLRAAAGKGRQITFLQVSTDEVYGSLGPEGQFTEKTPLAPNSPYSASKAAGDLLCRSFFKTYGMPVLITRCSNNYGPYQHPEKLIPFFIMKALKDLPVPVYGDGLHVRDWLHVEDHCHALDLVVHKGRAGEIYNIGGNNETTNIEITRLILAELGKSEELITFVKDRPGHDRRYAIDSSEIQRQLGWQPRHTFQAGVRETIDWYRRNLDWLEAVTSSLAHAPDLVEANATVADINHKASSCHSSSVKENNNPIACL